VGPIATGLLYQQVSRGAPYVAGVGAILATLLLLRSRIGVPSAADEPMPLATELAA
jgi:hypothetical protein